MMTRWTATVAALAFPLAAGAAVGADPNPAAVDVDVEALQDVLDGWRNDVGAFGATLSLRVPDHDDVHLASGVDDRDIVSVTPVGPIEHTESPMPTDGTYRVMSVTKSFVAAAALQLVNEGRLSLNDPVEPWLPELPDADQVTLAMLLGHTSGLGEWDHIPLVLEDLTRIFTREEVLAGTVASPRYGEPGEHFAYSNGGYAAAGVLIERELDQDLAAVIEERFLEPLAMNDTLLSDGSTKPTRHGWFSIDPDPDLPLDHLDAPHEAFVTGGFGAAGIISSSADLLDWSEALYSGEVLGDAATASMLEIDRKSVV